MPYHTSNHRAYSLQAHIVLVCKYRLPLLVGDLYDDVYDICHEIARYNGFRILQINSDVNHLHVLIDYDPTIDLATLICLLKKYVAIGLWARHPEKLNLHFPGERTFFHDGSFVSSVGAAGLATVSDYIRDQGLKPTA